MFDLALAALLDVQQAWHAEVDPAASKVLAVHWPGVPNHGDITTTDWASVERVDALCGGIPCQSWSLAGKRKGSDDERDLWPVRKTDENGKPRRGALDAIRELRPRLFVLENVPGLLTAEQGIPFGTILADLDRLGYAAAWTVVGACRVGACHHRHRLFLAAVPAELVADTDRPSLPPSSWRTPTGWQSTAGTLFGDGGPVSWPQAGLVVDGHAWPLPADPCGATGIVLPTPTATAYGSNQSPSPGAAVRPSLEGVVTMLPTPTAHCDPSQRGLPNPETAARRMFEQGRRNLEDAVALLPTPRTSDVRGSGDLMLPTAVQPGRFGPYEAAVRRQEAAFGIPAPDPTEPGRLGKPRLAAAFPEFMIGLPRGWVTDHVGRNEAIKIAGNGLVWQACAYALPLLPTFRAFVASISEPSEVAA